MRSVRSLVLSTVATALVLGGGVAGATGASAADAPAAQTAVTTRQDYRVLESDWTLKSISTRKFVTRATLRIDLAGKVTGNDGCNSFWGNAALDRNTGTMLLEITGQTRLLCFAPSAIEPASDFEGVLSYTVSDSQLTIANQRGDRFTFAR